MGKIIKLTESDLTRIVKRVLKEEQQQEKINNTKKQIEAKTDSCFNKQKYPLLWKIVEMTAASPFCLSFAIYAMMTQPGILISHLKGDHEYDVDKYTNLDGSGNWRMMIEMPSYMSGIFCTGTVYQKLKEALKLGLTKDDKLYKEITSYMKCITGF